MGRLILGSNRLPFTIETSATEARLPPCSGGLVPAIKSYLEKNSGSLNLFEEVVWIGSVDFSPQDLESVKEQISQQNFNIELLFVEENAYDCYYDGFSNSTLWPPFQYFLSLVESQIEFLDAYRTVNQQFAPQLSRQQKPNATIG